MRGTSASEPAAGGLEARVALRLGTLDLDVALHVAPGEVLAVLGPNGAGKSTVLRALAGLAALEAGHVRIDGGALDDPGLGVWVPAERRPVGVVFQDYLLFPTQNVLDNVAFGLRARRMGRREAHRRAAELLERFGLTRYARQKPTALSGGQAQRVALARSLAVQPRLLLLDEPLAALDAATRTEVRRDLRDLLAGFDGMRVLVTHDPLDAYALADRVVVVEGGRVSQSGTLAEVTAHPRSAYVARLVGTNLLSGIADADRVVLAGGAVRFVAADRPAPGPVHLAVHPRAVALHRRPPEGSPRNTWPATVVELDHHADRVRVVLSDPVGLVAEITPLALHELRLEPGTQLWAAVKATEVDAYPA
ncbi:MAG: ATP-binding cassette domain-containing protein [Acidimicrobiia bacterium]|nr:ATP-binding cassette domain-containing protein [Acidimicrobiia bacterium]